MTISVADAIGDAIAAEINDKVTDLTIPTPLPFTAVRAGALLSQFEGLAPLVVIVVPDRVRECKLITRGKIRGYYYVYDILVYAPVPLWLPTNTPAQNNAVLDPFKLLTEGISDWFNASNPLAHYAGAQPIEEAIVDPLVDEVLLASYAVFGSMIEIGVFLQRQM